MTYTLQENNCNHDSYELIAAAKWPLSAMVNDHCYKPATQYLNLLQPLYCQFCQDYPPHVSSEAFGKLKPRILQVFQSFQAIRSPPM